VSQEHDEMFDEADYYTCNEAAESFSCTHPDEAIEEWLDNVGEDPEAVTVYAYARNKISQHDQVLAADDVLTRLLDSLDEEYGGPDPSYSTPKMEEAARAFVDAVVAEYHVWRCDKCGEREYNIKEWRVENARA
jgi:hypothetical protein